MQNNATISAILQKLPVFAGLNLDEYEHIRQICIPSQHNDGETVFVEGDSSPCMYVLLSGEVQLRAHNLGVIHTLQPGELFGEIGLVSQKPRTATAVVCAPSVLLQINDDAFQTLLNQHPRISFTIMRNITINMANHLERMNHSDTLDYLPPGRA
ncbi:MAG: cyclic nucleotide-binding domain-containing protein [Gammaproteobacteria bacterium]|nr:cyclic nucleotide-binding domain-containing protein [Gammaproteobacteria bacterium]